MGKHGYEDLDEKPDALTWEDCLQWLGASKTKLFNEKVAAGQRIGQAYFAMLSVDDKDKLQNSPHNPYYMDSKISCIDALYYLLEQ